MQNMSRIIFSLISPKEITTDNIKYLHFAQSYFFFGTAANRCTSSVTTSKGDSYRSLSVGSPTCLLQFSNNLHTFISIYLFSFPALSIFLSIFASSLFHLNPFFYFSTTAHECCKLLQVTIINLYRVGRSLSAILQQ